MSDSTAAQGWSQQSDRGQSLEQTQSRLGWLIPRTAMKETFSRLAQR